MSQLECCASDCIAVGIQVNGLLEKLFARSSAVDSYDSSERHCSADAAAVRNDRGNDIARSTSAFANVCGRNSDGLIITCKDEAMTLRGKCMVARGRPAGQSLHMTKDSPGM